MSETTPRFTEAMAQGPLVPPGKFHIWDKSTTKSAIAWCGVEFEPLTQCFSHPVQALRAIQRGYHGVCRDCMEQITLNFLAALRELPAPASQAPVEAATPGEKGKQPS